MASLSQAKAPSLQDRRTPRWLFCLLERELRLTFRLDAAAASHNAMCRRYYDGASKGDGLARRWVEATFCNPPFRDSGDWVAKANAEAGAGVHSVLVLPVGCSQTWYHRLARRWSIWVPDGRVNFDTPDGQPTGHGNPDHRGADRDTMIVAFGPRFRNPRRSTFLVRSLAVREWPWISQ